METPLFPNQDAYNAQFLAVSQKVGVPVSILKGFAALESAFNPKAYRAEVAISDASYGLMQILNRTAQGEGFKGLPDALYDPYTNIFYGGSFLKKLLMKYPDLSQAVAAYNMGYPRLEKDTTTSIKAIYPASDADRATWTYANQPYVDRVMAYIAYYQTFETGDAAKRALILDAIKKKIMGPLHAWPLNPWSGSSPADSSKPATSDPS